MPRPADRLLALFVLAGPCIIACRGRARPDEIMPTVRATPPLHVAVAGSGPPVVLIHGLGGRHDAWNGIDAALAKAHTVLAVDLPGHGASPARAGELFTSEVVDFGTIAGQIAGVLLVRDLRGVTVIGHSIGGSIAPWVYAQAPDRVRTVIVIDSSVKPIPVPAEQVGHLMQELYDDKRRALREWFTPLARDDAQAAQLVEAAAQVDGHVLGLYFSQAASRDGRPLLEGKGVRVHLQASRLLIEPGPRGEREILDEAGMGNIAGATVTLFPKSAHWIHLDEPDACLADLQRVIDEPNR